MNVISSIVRYVLLPKEISEFERAHLARTNRVATRLFVAHLPFFVIVAWLNDTNPLLAASLTAAVLVIPLGAGRVLDSPRWVSVTHGFTAMMMGGLLVHFGQGPVQIEMHFYFFVMLALLSVFGNPLAIVVAAVTVALHHLVLWIVLPSSVFNYDAHMWVVAVHAAFVVVESIAVIFLARSFFDNVIGLERIVAQRTSELDQRNRDMRLILDHAQQGFLTLDREGRVGSEASAIVERWLGKLTEGSHFATELGQIDLVAGETFALGWEELREGNMPRELVLDQLPSKLTVHGSTLRVSYTPIDRGAELAGMLIVMDDVTAANARARLEVEQRETAHVVERFMNDRNGFMEFFEESHRLIERIATADRDDAHAEIVRYVHTLKGNAALFDLESIAEQCHAIEGRMIDDCRLPSRSEREELARRWAPIARAVHALSGERRRFEIEESEYEAALAALANGAPRDRVARMMRGWRLEPMAVRLERLAEQARRLAARLGKRDVRVEIDHGNLRLSRGRWAPFWSSVVHVLRNAVDHGIEPCDERASAGKAAPTISLATRADGTDLVVSIGDDGRGIDFDALRAAAEKRGLASSDEELLFASVSTARTVTNVSGRGVGMAAVREATEVAGGRMRVETERGRGTRVEFRFAIEENDVVQAA